MSSPYILEETDGFAVVYKPPKMHTALNQKKNRSLSIKSDNAALTLHEWFAEKSSRVFDVMHRLDYETNGLVLFAKNEKSYNFFKAAQHRGEFIKEYSAVCSFTQSRETPSDFAYKDIISRRGFPPCPLTKDLKHLHRLNIESYFRPYGPGRKLVRPVIDDKINGKETAKDRGGRYITEITSIKNNVFTVRIKRGFRHQIRCHLCWIGFPIINDPLYSHQTSCGESSELALRSHALFFPDPCAEKQCEYRISGLDEITHV